MNWEIKDLMCDIEVIKEKINDVAIKHGWFVEDKFVKNEHTVELLQVYLKEFGELIQKFHEIEKASSENFGEESDDAKKLKITE